MKIKIRDEIIRAYEKYIKMPIEERKGIQIISCMDIKKDKIYEVMQVEDKGFYRIIDESGEDYMYPPEMFEVVEE